MGLLLAAPWAAAQGPQPSEKVFATSVNNQVVEVDFATQSTTTVVPDGGSSLQGCAVRNDLRIVVADHNQQGAVKIFSGATRTGATITPSIAFPSGVTVDPVGNVFITNSNSSGQPDEVWRARRDFQNCLDGEDPISCTNAGYVTERMDTPSTGTLADAKAVGDSLYVLVESPPQLLKYVEPLDCGRLGNDPCVGVPVSIDFDGQTPTGLAFTASELLVTTAGGRILRYRTSDHARLGDFADVGGVAKRIAVGIQAVGNPPVPTAHAFVTVHSGTVRRYEIRNDGTAGDETTVGGLNNTVGVCIASGAAAITSAGVNQLVALNSVEATFENVLASGLSDASCTSCLDIREGPDGICDDLDPDSDSGPLGCDLPLNHPQFCGGAFNFENEIPSYVRAFKKNANDAQGTFRLCIAKTTAGFSDLIEVHGDQEAQWLGYAPLCDGTRGPGGTIPSDPTMRPRFFVSEEPPLPALLEGRVFINHSSLCGSDGADAWNMDSLWVTGARETRADDAPGRVAQANEGNRCSPAAGVGDCQLNRLRALLTASTCIPSRARKAFLTSLDRAIQRWDHGDYCDAAGRLATLEDDVQNASASSFPAACPVRLRAEIRGRANAAAFTAGNAGACP